MGGHDCSQCDGNTSTCFDRRLFVRATIRIANLMHDPVSNRIRTQPRAEGTLSRLAIERAKAAGIDVTPLMVKAGVTRQQVEREDVSLTVQGQIKLVELIGIALQDDLLGFHLARDADLREIGLLYYVLDSSDRLGDAFRRGERYCSLINEGVRLRVREGKGLALVVTYVGVERRSDRHQIEAWVTFLVRICRRITNGHLLPCVVSFLHRREGGSPEMNAFMGRDVVFGADADEVVFLGNAQQLPVVDSDPYLTKLLVRFCE